jgi:hypothetical protein
VNTQDCVSSSPKDHVNAMQDLLEMSWCQAPGALGQKYAVDGDDL